MTIGHGNRWSAMPRRGSGMAGTGLRFLSLLVPAALAACQEQAVHTNTPDKCVFTYIFDNFQVAWPPPLRDRVGVASSGKRSRLNVDVPPGARGRPVQLDIRGFYQVGGPGVTARALARVAGRDRPIRLPDGEKTNDFFQSIEAVVPKDAKTLPVGVHAWVSSPTAGIQALLSIDSVDLRFTGPNCSAAAEIGRPPVTEEADDQSQAGRAGNGASD